MWVGRGVKVCIGEDTKVHDISPGVVGDEGG